MRDQILAAITTLDRPTAGEIIRELALSKFPSRVVNELNAMRLDGVVDCSKAKGEIGFRYHRVKPQKVAKPRRKSRL